VATLALLVPKPAAAIDRGLGSRKQKQRPGPRYAILLGQHPRLFSERPIGGQPFLQLCIPAVFVKTGQRQAKTTQAEDQKRCQIRKAAARMIRLAAIQKR
jgi:hypothetical protein